MKRFLWLLFVFAFAVPSFAQSITPFCTAGVCTALFPPVTSAGTQIYNIYIGNTGTSVHNVTFTTYPKASVITVVTSASTDGVNFTQEATSSNNSDTASFTGAFVAVGIKVTTLTGSGATVQAVWTGSSTVAGGDINGSCSTTNALAKFTALTTLGCSSVVDNGTTVTSNEPVVLPTATSSTASVLFGSKGTFGSDANFIYVGNGTTTGSTSPIFAFGLNNQIFGIDGSLGFGGTTPASVDTILTRDAPNTLALRNGTNAQTFNIYNTYTDSSDYEAFQLAWLSNTVYLTAKANGTGTSRSLAIGTEGNVPVIIRQNGGTVAEFNGSAFFPQVDNSYGNGTHANRWATANIVALNDVSTINVTNGSNVAFGASVNPNQDNTNGFNLGLHAARWSGSHIVSIDDLATINATNAPSTFSVGTSNFSFGITSTGFTFNAPIKLYNNINTAGWGVPAIYANGRSTTQNGAVSSVTTYTPASDGSFEVSANVLVTASVTNSFTVTCAYTDESSASRTLTLTFSNVGGTLLTTITNVTGTGAYEGVPLHIRARAGTAITVATVGTFTSVTYNVEAIIRQLA